MGVVGTSDIHKLPPGTYFTDQKPPERTPADHKLIDLIDSQAFKDASPEGKKDMLKNAMRGMSEEELRTLTAKNPAILELRDEVLREKTGSDDI